ncbi:TetR/AcrR family transcriptional regulator [Actinoalloteichus spitiensis]|uniref:TetR/AcrR family transcriptional regulator n=1 Tax=Actinoalloteichus spitiensis TaxID=252394 RepID=UPI0003635FDA|nr:TetR/AcrR family transcriptional regulator [Actinoalloteichus spitiensis]
MSEQSFSVHPGPLRADAARNRDRILDAARELVREGDGGLPLNVVARRAGVGVGTVYRHFPTSGALLESLVAGSLDALVESARAAVSMADPAAALVAFLEGVLRGQLADEGLRLVLTRPAFACVETGERVRELLAALAALLERATRAGVVRPEITPDDVRRLLIGTHEAVRAGTEVDDRAGLYLGILVAGLRPEN